MGASEYQEIAARLDRIEKLALLGSKEVLSIDECVILTGYTKSHLYRMTSQRKIPFYKPMGGTIYFKKSEVEQWLLQNRQETESETAARTATYCKTKKTNK